MEQVRPKLQKEDPVRKFVRSIFRGVAERLSYFPALSRKENGAFSNWR
jgi:hypothetical protein